MNDSLIIYGRLMADVPFQNDFPVPGLPKGILGQPQQVRWEAVIELADI